MRPSRRSWLHTLPLYMNKLKMMTLFVVNNFFLSLNIFISSARPPERLARFPNKSRQLEESASNLAKSQHPERRGRETSEEH